MLLDISIYFASFITSIHSSGGFFLHSCSLFPPSFNFRPTSFWTNAQMEQYVTLIQRACRASSNAGVRRLLFGSEHNSLVSAQAFFAALSSVQHYTDALVYIHCLDSKYLLRWSGHGMHAVTNRISAQLFRLGPEIHHEMDICLTISMPQQALFVNRRACHQFATRHNLQASFFHPFSLATAGNMQGKCPEDGGIISRVNFYSDFVSNLRSCGRMPTSAIQSVVSLLQPLGDLNQIRHILLCNTTTIES
jgi:hypothetical protein